MESSNGCRRRAARLRRFAIAWLACLSSALAASAALGADANDAALRAHLARAVSEFTPGQSFMGAALVAVGDRTLLDKGYGLADARTGLADAPDTKFRIGSLTKQFTAAAILLLQQDGKLSVGDPVSRYLPDTPPAWADITLAELLGHTSGIPDFTRDPTFAAWNQTSHTRAEVLARFRDKPLEFKPGSRFDYSSSGYELLGAVIEKVSGKSYATFLRERIFEPLGMRDTGLDRDGVVVARHAIGYRGSPGGALTPALGPSVNVAWSAGALYSTTDDLLRWESGLFGGRLLSPASLKLMTTPGLGGYGMGVIVSKIDGLTLVWHPGIIDGFGSCLLYAPDRRVTVAVLGNVQGPLTVKIGHDLMAIALGHSDVLPPATPKELDRFVGDFDLAGAGSSLTFRRDGDALDAISNGVVAPVVYEGATNGAPTFFEPLNGDEITFGVDASGAVNSLVLHEGGRNTPGVRRTAPAS